MKENINLLVLLDEPAKRRCWLLYKALEHLPLDHAIGLARRADTFVSGDLPAQDECLLRSAFKEAEENARCSTPGNPEGRSTQVRISLALSPEARDLLLQRFAEGARNKDLASEFGLTPRQVQGCRMGSAREIARRRARLVQPQPPQDKHIAILPVEIGDVVRYLRQQDDVVVPQRDNDFLVNGRFHLGPTELLARANRMRVRQRKPHWTLPG